VRVCDAFGSGYFYVPGTRTCLSLGGYLQFDAWLYDSDGARNYFNVTNYLTGAGSPTADPSNPLAQSSGAVAGYLYDTDDYAAPWTFSEEIKLIAQTQTQTDLGIVSTYMRFVLQNGADATDSNTAQAL